MTMKNALKECGVFCTLGNADLDQIEKFSSVEDYQAGATIFTEGTSSQKLYVLQSGKVALQMQLPNQSRVGRRVSVDIVTRNEAFGWSALVEPHLYTLMAVCLEPTRVVAVDAGKLRSLLDEDKRVGYELLKRLIGVVASRLEETRHVLISERLMVV
ncbi:MAG: cyclic nucleotide-binding domain-containing protein [Chloroflexi bacterium]|nr:cyclic nucleotide-binding domain-containing protein [Chloroflexota bacterium]